MNSFKWVILSIAFALLGFLLGRSNSSEALDSSPSQAVVSHNDSSTGLQKKETNPVYSNSISGNAEILAVQLKKSEERVVELDRSLHSALEQLKAAKHELASLQVNQLFISNGDPNKQLQLIEEKFRAEQIDSSWAPKREKELSNLFVENEGLAGVALKSMQCKEEQCQLVLAASDLDDANKNFDLLFKALGANGQKVYLVASPNVQKNATTLYLSRDGTAFEFK